MGCRCAERAKILKQTAQAVRHGDVRAAMRRSSVVVRSMADDARAAAQRASSAARLMARRRAG